MIAPSAPSPDMPLTRHGIRELLIASLLFAAAIGLIAWAATAAGAWLWAVGVSCAALWLFVLAFFRDPNRAIPTDPGLLVSPADGRVTAINRLDHCDEIGGPALRVSIFLSLFDVHVNRSPCAGRVLRTDYCPGEFLDARHPESGRRNESNTIVIEPDPGLPGPVVVRQIAGLIARRIVCPLRPGDRIERGGRIGMIKFGSRTDLLVPAESKLELAVNINDHVKGGSTVLLRLRAEGPAASRPVKRRGTSAEAEGALPQVAARSEPCA